MGRAGRSPYELWQGFHHAQGSSLPRLATLGIQEHMHIRIQSTHQDGLRALSVGGRIELCPLTRVRLTYARTATATHKDVFAGPCGSRHGIGWEPPMRPRVSVMTPIPDRSFCGLLKSRHWSSSRGVE